MVITYRDALSSGNKLLKDKGIDTVCDARVLLCHAAKIDTLRLTLCANEPIPDAVYSQFLEYISRRISREPVSYITGIREFMGLDFKVAPGVLIPRPETEHTVEYIISLLKEKNADILDLCTGSGAIALSLAKYLPKSRITAVDISEKAISIASENATRLKVDDRVTIACANVLEKIDFGKKFDVIASNPPYIPNNEVLSLDPDVRVYEPHLALCGGDDGLSFYRAITKSAPDLLKNGGSLVYEVGYDQAEQVAQIMKNDFENIGFEKDLAGINRVVHGTLKY